MECFGPMLRLMHAFHDRVYVVFVSYANIFLLYIYIYILALGILRVILTPSF